MAAEEDSVLDLSGVWRGQYSYPRSRPPVPFTATLRESESWLVGDIEEIGQVGEARGLIIHATLQGRRTGRAVIWLKTYDSLYRLYDAVRYEGEANADGTEIEGRWSIPGNWSGRFIMIRDSGPGLAARKEVAEKV